MKVENLFYFVQHPKKLSYASIASCLIEKNIKTTDELFHSLDQQLSLQVVEGNWDALMDRLCDFEDVKKNILL